ncbi:hypothetical protein [Nitrosospira multiformis]|uniref:hypothetical protein n=1 Tax=Nitrosospira multiformis TaxID=1231 RepID=UPI001113DC9C|nr:hypothetical protein [Nitrosospira multiformis]
MVDIAGSRDNGGVFREWIVYPARQGPGLKAYISAKQRRKDAAKHFSARVKADDTNRISALVEQIPVFIPLSIILEAGLVKYRIR